MIHPMLQEFTISAAGKVIAAFVAGMVALAALGYSYVQPLWNQQQVQQQVNVRLENKMDELLERSVRIETKLDMHFKQIEK